MRAEVNRRKNLFQLTPKDKTLRIEGNVLSRGRFLVGRAESCDIVIASPVVSAVHAVIECTEKTIKIYDMNSRNGTYINGDKVVASEINFTDTVSIGDIELNIAKYENNNELPPVLGVLEPSEGRASVIIADSPAVLPKDEPEVISETPYIVYPLSSDPKSDYSEYIFEAEEDLVPIFKYEVNQQAVEVIILFNDKVYSVDYLSEKDGVYQIAGSTSNENEVEFPYLGKDEKVPFIEMHSGNCIVHELHNYNCLHLSEKDIVEPKDKRVNLQGQDIVKLKNDHLEIYVRKVSAPPKVKAAPFFKKDGMLWKNLILILLLVLLPVIALNFYEVDEELKKEKEPERIATILYNQKLTVKINKQVEKTEKKKAKKQTAKKKVVTKKSKPKQKNEAAPTKSKSAKKPTPNPGKKSALKKQVVKKVKNPAPKRKKVAPAKTRSASKARSKTAKTRLATTKNRNKGTVDVYKSFDFKSTVSNLMAKGGSLRGAKTATSTSSDIASSTALGGGVETNLKKAAVGTEVGSLTGATVGKLGVSKGTEGLTTKTGVYTAGIPSETVVLGSMDPDVIRRILRENIPQFRYCYQKELDRSSGRDVSGTIGLSFTIGASGSVSRAGVNNRTSLPPHVKKCVVGVLRGIQFPRPMGGGTVDVKQPFNFQSKKL